MHGDISAQHSGGLAGDCEAQSSAFMFSCRCPVHLTEFVKDIGQIAFRNAYAGIRDPDKEPSLIQPNRNRHTSRIGKFYGIGDQVLQNLGYAIS